MTNCITVRAARHQMFVMVHQCFRNTLNSHQKQFYRELRTFINPQIRISSGFRYNTFKCHSHDVYWRNSFPTMGTASIYNTRCAYMSEDKKFQIHDDTELDKEKKLTLFQKFKLMYKKYWYVLLPVHVVTSLCWFGSFYYAVVSGVDIPELMVKAGAPEYWIETFKSSGAGNIVATYTLYKLFTPLRYAVSVGCTTMSINKLKKWGWIKPVPNKEEIKRMYQEQKGAFKDLTSTYQDKLKMRKDDLIKKKDTIKEHYVEARDGLQRSVIESKRDLKKGVEGFSVEMKHLGASCKKSFKKMIKREADYVAQPIHDKEKIKKRPK